MAWLLRRRFRCFDPSAGSKIEHIQYFEDDLADMPLVTSDPANARQFPTRHEALTYLNYRLPGDQFRATRAAVALHEHRATTVAPQFL